MFRMNFNAVCENVNGQYYNGSPTRVRQTNFKISLVINDKTDIGCFLYENNTTYLLNNNIKWLQSVILKIFI